MVLNKTMDVAATMRSCLPSLMIQKVAFLLTQKMGTRDYFLDPAGGVKVNIHMIEGSIESEGNKDFVYGTAGDTTDAAPPERTITIFASSPTDPFASAIFTISDKTNSNTCHLFFNVDKSDTEYPAGWKVKVDSGDDDTQFQPIQDEHIHLAHPTPAGAGGGGGGGAELYQNFDEKKVFLVDYNSSTGSMMFRGNEPLTRGHGTDPDQRFDWAGVHAAMKTRFESQVPGATFPEPGKYVVHDIAILSPAEEQITQEKASFDADPSVVPDSVASDTWFPSDVKSAVVGTETFSGKFILHPIFADPRQAASVNTFTKKMAQWMDDVPSNTTNVYYFHCASGMDRTAICAVSYLTQRYPKLSLSDAFISGTTIAGGGATILGTRDLSKTKRRAFPAPGTYNGTILACFNLARGDTKTLDDLTSSDGASEKPEYVEEGYPWEGSQVVAA